MTQAFIYNAWRDLRKNGPIGSMKRNTAADTNAYREPSVAYHPRKRPTISSILPQRRPAGTGQSRSWRTTHAKDNEYRLPGPSGDLQKLHYSAHTVLLAVDQSFPCCANQKCAAPMPRPAKCAAPCINQSENNISADARFFTIAIAPSQWNPTHSAINILRTIIYLACSRSDSGMYFITRRAIYEKMAQ